MTTVRIPTHLAPTTSGGAPRADPGYTVAIAHDYLTQRGGAERVVLALARAFPGSPIYTTLYEPDTTYPEFADLDVRASPVNRVRALRHHHRAALPLLPFVSSAIKIDADVVISSSSGWSHGFRTDGHTLVYCYSPARWLYQRRAYLGDTGHVGARLALGLIGTPMKAWDRRAAHRASKYLAISTAVQQRIDATYGLDSDVVPAPYTIDNTGMLEPVLEVELSEHPAGYYLCISRLLPYKNVDKVIAAFTGTARTLVVVGAGPEEEHLKSLAPANVIFTKDLTDAQIRWLYSRCAGLIAASFEDYGLTPLEACTYGKPSAVLRWGGFLDTLEENSTGVYFDSPEPHLIRDAVDRLERRQWDGDRIRCHVDQFSEKRFATKIRASVAELADVREPQVQTQRVLFMTHSAKPSGAEIYLADLCDALSDAQPSIASFETGWLTDRARSRDIPTVLPEVRSGSARFGRHSGLLSTLAGLLDLVRSGRSLARCVTDTPDVVVAWSTKALIPAWFLARSHRAPLVWSVHDRISADYFGRTTALLVRAIGRVLADAYVANSRATLSTLSTGAKPTLVSHPSLAAPAARPPGHDRTGDFTVVMVGRLSPWKGQHVLMQALPLLTLDSKVHVVMVGAALFGEDDYHDRLVRDSQQLPDTVTVEFTGHTDDVDAYLARADVVVHASTIPEPFGLVVLEAMRAGVAVVASRPGGPAEMIDDGTHGLLVDCGDVAGLADALQRLYDDPALRRTLGHAAQVRSNDFTLATSAPALAEWLAALR